MDVGTNDWSNKCVYCTVTPLPGAPPLFYGREREIWCVTAAQKASNNTCVSLQEMLPDRWSTRLPEPLLTCFKSSDSAATSPAVAFFKRLISEWPICGGADGLIKSFCVMVTYGWPGWASGWLSSCQLGVNTLILEQSLFRERHMSPAKGKWNIFDLWFLLLYFKVLFWSVGLGW